MAVPATVLKLFRIAAASPTDSGAAARSGRFRRWLDDRLASCSHAKLGAA